MIFGVLGTLLLRPTNVPVRVGGAKPRAMLALLLVNRNLPVRMDRIVGELWPESPPDSAIANVRTYASALRQALPTRSLPDSRAWDLFTLPPCGRSSAHPHAAEQGQPGKSRYRTTYRSAYTPPSRTASGPCRLPVTRVTLTDLSGQPAVSVTPHNPDGLTRSTVVTALPVAPEPARARK